MVASVSKTNHDFERYYFEQFRKVYELPLGTVSYGDKPDVVIKGDRTVGIEITNFFIQPGEAVGSEQRQGPRRKTVVAEAQKRYRGTRGKGIELTIGFNPAKPISSKREKKLAEELARLAAGIDTQPTGPVDPANFSGMSEIAYIWLNSKEYLDAEWRIAQVHSVELMSLSRLKSIVESKESKAAEYALCDAYWLLIVVDWIDRAQDQEIGMGDLGLVSSVFERIIVYKTTFEQIVEVKA
ncbi:hypothetical protein [Rhodoplanes serenus]|uniref:hypothetical protein n=1 Tax=Rhodoplanes serenus TaxID=200615 RepID=UPI0011B94411|nr:hypothetical protein [Rhodoplanes serenus]